VSIDGGACRLLGYEYALAPMRWLCSRYALALWALANTRVLSIAQIRGYVWKSLSVCLIPFLSLSNSFYLGIVSLYVYHWYIYISLFTVPLLHPLSSSSTLPRASREKVHRVDEFQLEHNNTRLGARRQ
jgi:hypothetical protein